MTILHYIAWLAEWPDVRYWNCGVCVYLCSWLSTTNNEPRAERRCHYDGVGRQRSVADRRNDIAPDWLAATAAAAAGLVVRPSPSVAAATGWIPRDELTGSRRRVPMRKLRHYTTYTHRYVSFSGCAAAPVAAAHHIIMNVSQINIYNAPAPLLFAPISHHDNRIKQTGSTRRPQTYAKPADPAKFGIPQW